MDSESQKSQKERQKMLQQHHRQLKRQNGKENIPPCSKRRKDNVEIDEPAMTPRARVYPWISHGLDRHTLGNMDNGL
jgi:hypothetical protein